MGRGMKYFVLFVEIMCLLMIGMLLYGFSEGAIKPTRGGYFVTILFVILLAIIENIRSKTP